MRRSIAVAVALAAPVLLAACEKDRPQHVVSPAAMTAYVDPASALPHVRFDDGQVSLNDHCPIRKGKLNLKMPPVYVNGKPIGFC